MQSRSPRARPCSAAALFSCPNAVWGPSADRNVCLAFSSPFAASSRCPSRFCSATAGGLCGRERRIECAWGLGDTARAISETKIVSCEACEQPPVVVAQFLGRLKLALLLPSFFFSLSSVLTLLCCCYFFLAHPELLCQMLASSCNILGLRLAVKIINEWNRAIHVGAPSRVRTPHPAPFVSLLWTVSCPSVPIPRDGPLPCARAFFALVRQSVLHEFDASHWPPLVSILPGEGGSWMF